MVVQHPMLFLAQYKDVMILFIMILIKRLGIILFNLMFMNNLTRDDISEYINQKFGLTKRNCSEIVNNLLEEIISGLIKNNIVKIHNFGTFRLKQKNSRIGRNPKTKKEVMISSRNVISFTPSKKILNGINVPINERKNL